MKNDLDILNKCGGSVYGKTGYRSEGTTIIAIKLDGKWGICAPYKCPYCDLHHITSQEDTVRIFYGRRVSNGNASRRYRKSKEKESN